MKPDTVVLDPAQQAAAHALESLLDQHRRPVARGTFTRRGRAERGSGRLFGTAPWKRQAEIGRRRPDARAALGGHPAEHGHPPAHPAEPGDLRASSGIYLHGRPGRGKTMVMDRFFTSVDTDRKRRFHFHNFFAALHAAAHTLGSIERAIDDLLGDADLVCFDEFHVTDIGDAMLLARLLDALFAGHRTLVVTSNYRPEDLLPNPLFHDHFLPSIAKILAKLDVVTLDGPLDYRTLTSSRDSGFLAGRYLLTGESPTEFAPAAQRRPEKSGTGYGAHLTSSRLAADPVGPGRGRRSVDADPAVAIERPLLDVPLGNGRTIRAHVTTDDTITLDFHDICAAPTSAADYLYLAERYRHWTLRAVPALREVPPDWSMRLVNLVDVLYDADLPFTIHAPEPPHDLTTGVPAIPDLARTASRLGELPLTRAADVRTA